MEDCLDVFIVLLGGVGILDELFDVWIDGYFGIYDKFIVMVDFWGYFDGLWVWLNGLFDIGYVLFMVMEWLVVVDNVKDVLWVCVFF